MERRLAAILLTDMVSYSRLMGLDEVLANRLRLLEEAGVPEQPIDHKNY